MTPSKPTEIIKNGDNLSDLLNQLKKVNLEVEGFEIYSATTINGDCFEIQINFPEAEEVLHKLAKDMGDNEREEIWDELQSVATKKAEQLSEKLGEDYIWHEVDLTGSLDIRFGEDKCFCGSDECSCDGIEEIDLDSEEDDLL